MGSIDLEFAGTRHEFHLVDNLFPIKEDGILSAAFLRAESATICFKNNQIFSRNTGVLPLSYRPSYYAINTVRILATSTIETPKTSLRIPQVQKQTATLLIDTGADVNIMKLDAINPDTRCTKTDRVQITGVTDGTLETLGSFDVQIGGKLHKFYIVDNSIPIKQDGILSLKFLRDANATISFETNTVVFDDSQELKILDENIILIPPRTAQVIRVKVTNSPTTNSGALLLEEQNLGPNIFFGKALVTNRDGSAYTYAINSGESVVRIKRPTATLKEVVELTDTQTVNNSQILLTHSQKTDPSDDPHTLNISPNHAANRLEILKQNLRLEHLNNEEKQSIIELVTEYNNLFFLPGDKLGCTQLVSHTIPTTDDIPIHTKQYRYPQAHKAEINNQVTKLLEQNIIKHSSSPYNSPVWIVPKKDDARGIKKWRMVIDFRKLNEKTVGDAYPLPNITDILDQLGSAKYFSTFDLASGFHQIPMHPDHSSKTAFSTPHGHFEFNQMPFGLKNAPSTFQRLMDQALSGLQGNEAFVYLDDIVIYAESLEDHSMKFRKLMDRLRKAGLTLQPDKCEFLRKEVAYLGHIITQNGVKPNPDKIAAVRNYPIPKNPKQIKQFLGLIGYYRRFIPNMSKVAKPINNLLKKNTPFVWTSEHQRAFENLRDCLCNEPILRYPDFKKPFIVTTDASNQALGAILSQGEIGKDLPIAYASRALNQAETNYSTIDKELLAIVFAVKHFRPYLYGRAFTLVTDHRPLVWLNSVKDPTSRLLRWRLTLDEYTYDVVYKKGKANLNADALSRNPPSNAIQALPMEGKRPRSETDPTEPEISKKPKAAHQFPRHPRQSTDDTTNPAPLKRPKTQIEIEADNQPKGNLHNSDTSDVEMNSEKPKNVRFGETINPLSHQTKNIKRYRSTESSGSTRPRKIRTKLPDPTDLTDDDSDTEAIQTKVRSSKRRRDTETSSNPAPRKKLPIYKKYDSSDKKRNTSRDIQAGTSTDKQPGTTPPYSQFLLDLDFLPLTHNRNIREIEANLLKQNDNLAHCISADCEASQGIADQMVRRGLIQRKRLRSTDPVVTDIITVKYPRRTIYNLVTKQYKFNKPTNETMYKTLSKLKSALIQDGVQSISIPKLGCGIDELKWDMVKRMIHYIFKDTSIKITICNYNYPSTLELSTLEDSEDPVSRMMRPPAIPARTSETTRSDTHSCSQSENAQTSNIPSAVLTTDIDTDISIDPQNSRVTETGNHSKNINSSHDENTDSDQISDINSSNPDTLTNTTDDESIHEGPQKPPKLIEVRQSVENIFQAPAKYSLVHCAAQDYVMEKGLGKEFKLRFGQIDRLRSFHTQIGGVGVLHHENRFVFYLITRKKDEDKTTYATLETCFETLRNICEDVGIYNLAMTKLDSEEDNLDWKRIKELIEKILAPSFAIRLYGQQPPYTSDPSQEENENTPSFEEFITNLDTITPTTNVTESKDGLFTRNDNIVHCVHADCPWQDELTNQLINKNMLRKETFTIHKPTKGGITASKYKQKYIISLVAREKRTDRIRLEDLYRLIVRLKQILFMYKINSFSLTKANPGLDTLAWPIVKKLFYTIFRNTNIKIKLCTNEIIIPEESLREDIIKEYHESLIGGHQGVTKIYNRIREKYYWPNLKIQIQNFIKTCDSCQRKKLVRVKTKLPMMITDTPANAFDKVALDIVGPLPLTKSNNQYLLTIQCNLTKFLDAIPLPNATAQTIGTAFAKDYITRYGTPRTILTDQGQNFMSNTIKQISKLFKIKQVRTTAYHPQSNGSLERSHLVLIEHIKHYTKNGNDWDEYIRFAIFCYNTAKHESTSFTPHQLIFGQEARLPSDMTPTIGMTSSYNTFILDLLTNLTDIRKRAIENLKEAKLKSKSYYDRNINPQLFEAGQKVFLLNETRTKFEDHYKGPYIIKRIIDNINAEIYITQNKTKIVHLNKLKLAHIRD